MFPYKKFVSGSQIQTDSIYITFHSDQFKKSVNKIDKAIF